MLKSPFSPYVKRLQQSTSEKSKRLTVHKNKNEFDVSFQYDQEIVEKIKTIPSRVYCFDTKMWRINNQHQDDFLEEFSDYKIEFVDLAKTSTLAIGRVSFRCFFNQNEHLDLFRHLAESVTPHYCEFDYSCLKEFVNICLQNKMSIQYDTTTQ